MSLFVKINALLPSLSNSESKLAHYTLNHSAEIRALSSIELAKMANVSQSSVVKFAQKLGYRGFPDFKLGVVDALNQQNQQVSPVDNKITNNDTLNTIAEKLIQLKHQALLDTVQLNDTQKTDAVIGRLKAAKRVLFVAEGSSALVAKDAVFKLQKLGVNAQCEPDLISTVNSLSGLAKDDVLFIISDTGERKNLQKLARQAKQQDCQVILLTRYNIGALSDHADITLHTISGQDPIEHSAIITRASQSFVLDVLFIALSQSNLHWQKRVQKANENIRQFLD
ncbi:MurR/RpiR family transcriptional regulator [Pseudoalteromonas fenneropenaei]|uniref:MurR/RpiR family transcriptional regulator n=1 Tax=Pseudoalteromonas fenneropenaei TaxID=1737459 RepID=A0ABV7CEM3_9GAMM